MPTFLADLHRKEYSIRVIRSAVATAAAFFGDCMNTNEVSPTLDGGFGEEGSVCERKRPTHRPVVLVAHCTEHEVEVVVLETFDKRREFRARIRGMCAIEDHKRFVGHHLESARPFVRF